MRKRTPRKEDQLGFDFSAERSQISTAEMESPRGYTGFYRFHKYWGKKPHEPLAYIIEQLTSPGDIVLDPFCGSGTAGCEALLRSRKFVGFDINPVALEITRLLIHPPPPAELRNAAGHLAEAARPEILKSYLLEDGTTLQPTISGMPTSWKRCGSWDAGRQADVRNCRRPRTIGRLATLLPGIIAS